MEELFTDKEFTDSAGNPFTDEIDNDTLELQNILVEDDKMTSKFYNENTIYLYATMEGTTANTIIQTNKYTNPIKLYETWEIAQQMVSNVATPVTLRFAVDLSIEQGECYYDEFTMTTEEIKKQCKQYKVKDIQQYKAKCVYIRELVQTPQKAKVIQYTINKLSKIQKNPIRIK